MQVVSVTPPTVCKAAMAAPVVIQRSDAAVTERFLQDGGPGYVALPLSAFHIMFTVVTIATFLLL